MLEKVITILFLSGDVVSVKRLADFLGISKEEVVENTPYLKSKIEEMGLTLLSTNEGLSIVTKPGQSELVEAWTKEELKGELSPAALQVLTLVAYLGYPTRDQISYIRGVQSNQSIRVLTVRGLINRVGEVCSLTQESFKQLGITKVEELPEYETLHKEFEIKLQEKEQ
jgi:segregation and condensation protein B